MAALETKHPVITIPANVNEATTLAALQAFRDQEAKRLREYKEVAKEVATLEEYRTEVDKTVEAMALQSAPSGEDLKPRVRYRKRPKAEHKEVTRLTREKEAMKVQLAGQVAALSKSADATQVAQLEVLGRQLKEQEADLKLAMDKLTAKLQQLNLKAANAAKINQDIQAIMANMSRADQQIAELEATERKKHAEEVGQIPDRRLSELYGDILSTRWIVNMNGGLKSSDMIQRLEHAQREVEQGRLPPTADYANIDSYFMYSESRRCCVHLRRVSVKPAHWKYHAYYEPSPMDDVLKVFKSLGGRDATALPQCPIDKLAYADAQRPPR